MTFQTDLLGRPPVMRPIERRDDGPAPRVTAPGKQPGRIAVYLPFTAGALTDINSRWGHSVTLPAPPWQKSGGGSDD